MFVGGGDGGGDGDGDGDGLQTPLHHTVWSDHLTCRSVQSLPEYDAVPVFVLACGLLREAGKVMLSWLFQCGPVDLNWII